MNALFSNQSPKTALLRKAPIIGRMAPFGNRMLAGRAGGRQAPIDILSEPLNEVPSPPTVPEQRLPSKSRKDALWWYHAGRSVHFLAQSFFGVAQPIFLFTLVKQGLIAAVSGPATLSIALALASGALISRFGTRKVLAGSIIAMSAAAAAMPLLYWAGITPLWLMLGLNIGLSALAAAHTVGEASIISTLVGRGRSRLQKTNMSLETGYGLIAISKNVLVKTFSVGATLVVLCGILSVYVSRRHSLSVSD